MSNTPGVIPYLRALAKGLEHQLDADACNIAAAELERLAELDAYAGECYRALLLMSGCFDDEGNLDERFRDQLSVAMEAMETALDKGAALSKNTIESGDEEVRSLAAGGAQLTQGGGDAAGMPLSVGRSRPDQTATYPSTSPPVSAETSALATPNTLAGGGTIYESVGFQYRFPSPWGGYTWRDSDTRYNGHDCHGAREIFVIVKEGKAVNGVRTDTPEPDTEDRISRDRRDADRYRWLRTSPHWAIAACYFLPADTPDVETIEQIDAAIDAAMGYATKSGNSQGTACAKCAERQAFIDSAFVAHPNLDLDIEAARNVEGNAE